MIEEGDLHALAQLQQIKEAETHVRNVCQSLPQDRIVQGEDSDIEAFYNTDEGALPSFAAISVVEAYCRSLPAHEFVNVRPEFIVNTLGNGFLATCVFPPISEIPPVQGNIQKSESGNVL